MEEHETVDIIASGYEWICPICETYNTNIECPEIVTCENEKCRQSFFTKPPEHAIG